ncbi:MAG: acetolactate synthase small subunit [bacterium]|nr:acetolactate synthase small subunit [bacterium]
MKHTISVLVENRFGVLARVSGLFSGRGFNIDSLCVGETDDPTVSRMTIVVRGDERVLEQIIKQLRKLIDVIKVSNLTKEEHVERELVLIKVSAMNKKRAEIMEIVNIFRAKIIDVDHQIVTIEMTGDEDKISALIELMKPFGIKELVRTGRIAISRGGR